MPKPTFTFYDFERREREDNSRVRPNSIKAFENDNTKSLLCLHSCDAAEIKDYIADSSTFDTDMNGDIGSVFRDEA